MKIEHNVNLKQYTTIKIGGTAQNLYIPESPEELVSLIESLNGESVYYIGGGSNILMNDEKKFCHVVLLREFDKSMSISNGNINVGASMRLQKLINEINKFNYGGIEYLYSVPGLVGGAVAMNAGRGKEHNKCISDFIISILAYDCTLRKKVTLNKSECNFSYRHSRFKDNPNRYIILNVLFQFPQIDEKETTLAKKERLEYVKKEQDHTGHNAGSVFNTFNRVLIRLFRIPFLGKCGNCHYSRLTANWLVNSGEGKYKEAVSLIQRVEKLHRLLGQNIEKEIVIWD